MRQQNQSFGLKLGGTLLVTLLLLTMWFAQPAAGVTPPQQEGRPTLPPPGPVGPGGGESGEEGGVTAGDCAGLRGTVINWGYQNEPGVTLRLSDGGWEATQVTSTDGYYQFGALGEGVAFLSVDLSPKQAETLRPMADHVAIRLRCELDVIANLGLYSSANRPDPPATLSMSVSKGTVLPGQSATIYLALKNRMPNPISHVFVTDYLPEGLTVVDVASPLGSVEVLDGRMVTMNVGDMAQGEQATIQIVVRVDPTVGYGTRLKNTASLLYAESAADQAWATLVAGSLAESTPTQAAASAAQSDTATPAATSVVDSVTPTPAEMGAMPAETAAPTPPSPATTEETARSDDELLPVTGGGATVAIPAVGIGILLAIVLLAVRQLRNEFAGK